MPHLRRRNRGTFGPIRQGGIGFNPQSPLGGSLPSDPARLQELRLQVQQAQTPEERERLIGLLRGEAEGIQGRRQAGGDFLPVLAQFARAGLPLPGPAAAIQGLPTFTGAGADPRSRRREQPTPVPEATGGGQPETAPSNLGGPGGGLPLGRDGRPLPNDLNNRVGFVQPVNGTGLTIGGPTTAASLARLAPSQPLNNPLRTVNPA